VNEVIVGTTSSAHSESDLSWRVATLLCRLECVAFRPSSPHRVFAKLECVTSGIFPATGVVLRERIVFAGFATFEGDTKTTWDLRVSLSPKISPRQRIGTQIRVRLLACCLSQTHRDATWRKPVVECLGHMVLQVLVLVSKSPTAMLDLQPVRLHSLCVRYRPMHRRPRSGIPRMCRRAA
jgi:hypothetical protein